MDEWTNVCMNGWMDGLYHSSYIFRMELEEDVENIKLQRELRIKSTHIQTMETQHITLEKV